MKLNDFMTDLDFQSEVQERTLCITYSGRKGIFFCEVVEPQVVHSLYNL